MSAPCDLCGATPGETVWCVASQDDAHRWPLDTFTVSVWDLAADPDRTGVPLTWSAHSRREALRLAALALVLFSPADDCTWELQRDPSLSTVTVGDALMTVLVS